MFARQHFTFHGLLLAISLFVTLAPVPAKASDSGRPNPILRSPKDEANLGPKGAATAGLTAPRAKLAPSDLENQLNAMREQVRQLQSDKKAFETKLKEADTNGTALGDQVNKLQAEKTRLEVQLKEAQVEKARGEAAANQLQADKNALESKLQETTAAQSAAIAKVESKIQSLEEENDRLRATLNQALSNLAAAVEAAKNVKQTPPASVKTNRLSPNALFREGGQAYHAGDYATAATALSESATRHPSSGTLQNLGLAEWQRGIAGPAILAWEQSLFLDPFNKDTRMNLRFARKTVQLEAPDLTWYEVLSTWLPVNWWAWIATISFWLTIAIALLPGVLRRRKAAWHQAVAALSLMLFLLTLPALAGVHTRSRLGFVLQKDTPLRLTPTEDAQPVALLAAGEPARWQHPRGNYVLIRTNRGLGWVERAQFGLLTR